MTENEIRKSVVNIMQSWLGYSEANGKFKEILKAYNGYKPLPRGYALQADDEWCAGTVSAAFIKAGIAKYAPPECSCSKMIELYRKMGRWEERDDYKPQIGDVVMYDWQDDGKGDNKGAADHVGIVTAVNGLELTIIEGNKSRKVAYRDLAVNGRYIRGYCLPDYTAAAKSTLVAPLTNNPAGKVDYAKDFSKIMAKTYTVTASGLNMRRGASTAKAVIKVLKKGEQVRCYGYYTKNGSTVWLYVKDKDGDVGYCAKTYLQ